MKRFNAKLLAGKIALACLMALLAAGSSSAQSGRPKVLVLRPATAVDEKVVDKFQWQLAKELDRSGKFDIVKKGDYQKAIKALNLDRDATVPDSLIPVMMDSLQATIYAFGTLEQPGGKKTRIDAKVDYVIPHNDFTIEGEAVSVENEDKVGELARLAIEPLLIASERISLMSIARSYFNSAIYDKAIENYEKLLKLVPDDINVHYMIGLSHLKAQSKDAAFAKFEQILAEIDPDHKPTLEILASTSFGDEDFEQALKYYSKLAALEPDNFEYTRYWAYSLEKLNRKAEAAEVYEKLLQIKDNDPNIRNMVGYYYYTLADSLEKAGDSTAAMATAEKATVHMQRSVELCSESKDKGIEGWTKIHCNRLNLLALCQLKCSKNDEALETLQKLVELDPQDQYAYYRMGMIYYDRKQWTKAIDLFSKALPLVPENVKVGIYQRIGRMYDKQLKNYPKAIEAYNKLIPLLPAKNKNTYIFLRGVANYSLANQLDYAEDQNADLDQLIQDEKMTVARADRALSIYDRAEADLKRVTGRYTKSAKEHLANIVQLRDRLNKIKTQIEYYEKTK